MPAEKSTRHSRRGTRVYCVAQSKGGSGKTTYAFQLASAIAETRGEVLAIDADYTNQHLAAMIERRTRLIKANPKSPLPRINSTICLQDSKIAAAIEQAEANGVDVVIDVSAAHEALFIAAISMADVIVMPNRQGWMDLDAWDRLKPLFDLIETTRRARGLKKTKLFSLVTDFRPSQVGRALQERWEGTKGVTYLGTVPHSDRLARAVYSGMAYWEACPNTLRAIELREMLLRPTL